MDNSLENSFVEKVVLKNNLAQQAQLEQAKAECAQSGKGLLASLREMNLLTDEHVANIDKMFTKYKQAQGIAAEPAAPAAPSVQRIGPGGGAGSGGSAPQIQRIGPSGGAGSGGSAPQIQRIGPSGGAPAAGVQKIGPAVGTPAGVQKIGPTTPAAQKPGPAIGGGLPPSTGTPNPVLKIRTNPASTTAPAPAAPTPSAPPSQPKITLTGAGTAHAAAAASGHGPAVGGGGHGSISAHSAPRVSVAATHTQQIDAPPTPRDLAQYSHVHHYLEYARNNGASDLHINTNSPPIIRKHGKLIHLPRPPFSAQEAEKLLLPILTPQQREEIEEKKALDFCYTVAELGRYRSCILRQRNGWDGSFRVVKSQVPTFEELGLPNDLKRLTEYHQGLVLVTGPNGCGKSTTMAALLNLINQTREEHIISIEDPVEYIFDPAKCQVNQREVGQSTKSFANALRAALREDPDIIMIGELRDEETVGLAITAAETGHLVFGTLHTTSAGRTIDRVLDVFPPEEQGQIRSMISESIKGIICQQLIPRKDGEGRALALEILFNTPAVANLIRERKLHQLNSAMQTGKKLGMVLLDDSLMAMVKAGTIDGADAFFSAENKGMFQQWAPKAL